MELSSERRSRVSSFRGARLILAVALTVAASLGLAKVLTPAEVATPATPLPAASASAPSNIAVTWGFNGQGQLGDGANAGESERPVRVSGLSGVKAISAGDEYSLALLGSGDVVAWGENKKFQLGDGSTRADSPLPVAVRGLSGGTVRAISAGGDHSLALLNNGSVMAWGDNEDGQLGDDEAARGSREGLSEKSQGPFGTAMIFLTLDSWSGEVNAHRYEVYAGAAVRPPNGVATRSELVVFDGPAPGGYVGSFAPPGGGREPLRIVSAHGDVLNVSTSSGALLSFDVAQRAFVPHHEYGRLGDVPVEVKLPRRVLTAISAGGEFSLGLLSDGKVMAWGNNGEGQLGDGTDTGPQTCGVERTACSDTPVTVSKLSDATAIAAGANHSLALLKNGTVMAWGDNEYGELGDGTGIEQSDLPILVNKLSDVTAIAAGANDSLALLKNGTVMAWGSNESGQLGDGTSKEQSGIPVAVSKLREVTAIAAGEDFNLALLRNGTVMAWGEGVNDELGNHEANATQSDVPVRVSGLRDVKGIAAGGADGAAFGPPASAKAILSPSGPAGE
jgi:alpha-tubulin suppressor-like RCC1 family protein